MDISIFFARFYGSLFLILGLSSVGAQFLKRVIDYSEDKTITVSTGYITFLVGLVSVILHNIWVWDWRIAVTVLSWMTFLKGIAKILSPRQIHQNAQLFRSQYYFWGFILILLGAWLFWFSL